MRRLIFLVLSTLCLWSWGAFAQSNIRLQGVVLDSLSGSPVEGAEIRVEQTPFIAFSGANGSFTIENLPPGEYQLAVFRVGYKAIRLTHVSVQEDVPTRLVVSLPPVALQISEVVVQGEPWREPGETPSTVVFTRKQIEPYQEAGLTALLHQMPGLQLESPDGSEHQLRIRIHGSKANQVLVLLDGQRLNNPQTGEVDLSVINLETIERIEIIPHGYSARYGNQAYAGVVALYTRKTPGGSTAVLGGSGGSFRSASGEVGGTLRRGPLAVQASYQQNYSLQNYPYGYRGREWTRENAWYRYRKVFFKGTYHGTQQEWQLLWQRREGERGLPSPYFNEYRNFGAHSTESWQMAQLQHRWYVSNRLMWQAHVGVNQLVQQYDNQQDPSPFTRYFTENWNQTADAEGRLQFVAGSGREWSAGVQFTDERLKQNNFLYPRYTIDLKVRQSRAVFVNGRWQWQWLPLWESLQLQGAFRYEKYFDLPAEWFPYVAVAMVPAWLPTVSLSGGWQKAVRYPDFNSLFWKGDARARGNPNLLPERKQGWFMTAQWQGNHLVLTARYFSEQLTDLIYWHRGVNGIWEPRNLRQAEQRGLDVSAGYRFWHQRVNLQIAYSWLEAINTTPEPNTYRKRIIFIPPHTVNATLHLNWGGVVAALMFRYVDERQTVPANSPQTQLPPYRVWSAFLRYRWNWHAFGVQTGVMVKNIFNEDYQLIFGYPMPRRAWYVHVKLNWQQRH